MTYPLTSDPPVTPDDSVYEEAQCVTHGAFQQRVLALLPGMNPIRSRCPACLAADAEQAEERAKKQGAAERQMKIDRLIARSNIPVRFQERSFGDYDPEVKPAKVALAVCRRYAEDFASQSERGRSLVLTGGPGTGKTHLACAVANHVIEQNLSQVRFTTVSEMLRRIKETYRKDSDISESQVIGSFSECDLLIIDEIGVQVGSEHEKLLLFEVLNQRYNDLLPTILISNLSADELETFLGHRVMDRYRECGVILAFDWQSYRGKKQS
jgi:DNA replication protein DnaC